MVFNPAVSKITPLDKVTLSPMRTLAPHPSLQYGPIATLLPTIKLVGCWNSTVQWQTLSPELTTKVLNLRCDIRREMIHVARRRSKNKI